MSAERRKIESPFTDEERISFYKSLSNAELNSLLWREAIYLSMKHCNDPAAEALCLSVVYKDGIKKGVFRTIKTFLVVAIIAAIVILRIRL